MTDCVNDGDGFLDLFDMNGFVDGAVQSNSECDELSDYERRALVDKLNGYALDSFSELDQALSEQATLFLEEIVSEKGVYSAAAG